MPDLTPPACLSLVARYSHSYVAWSAQRGQVLCGLDAKQQAARNPANTLYGIKRLLGRQFDTPFVRAFAESVPFKVVAGAGGRACVEITDLEQKTKTAINTIRDGSPPLVRASGSSAAGRACEEAQREEALAAARAARQAALAEEIKLQAQRARAGDPVLGRG